MSFDAGIAQERLGILGGVRVNTSLLEGFELPTGKSSASAISTAL